MGDWIEVAAMEDIGEGGKLVVVGEEEILLVRRGSEVFALGYLCSHQDKELEGGQCAGDAWICPHHGARFDLRTGAALSMPAIEAVPRYEVKTEGGDVFVKGLKP
jgi:nitrite reductase/ring-hydroxylating ferredoxin subunit